MPGGEAQRETAFRLGVNLAMYATASTTKTIRSTCRSSCGGGSDGGASLRSANAFRAGAVTDPPYPERRAPDSTYNAWRLVSLSPLPLWGKLLLLGAAAASLVLAALGLRRELHAGRRLALLALRAVSALALAALLLEPGVRLLQTMRVKSRLLVLLDTSRSMGFAASPTGNSEAAVTREQAAARWFADHQGDFKSLEEQFQVEYFTFDKELTPGDFQRLAAGPQAPTGPRTDLLGALADRFSGQWRVGWPPGGGGPGHQRRRRQRRSSREASAHERRRSCSSSARPSRRWRWGRPASRIWPSPASRSTTSPSCATP